MSPRGRRAAGTWIALSVVAVAAGVALLSPGAGATADDLARQAARRAVRELVVGNGVLSWTFYALLAAILLLEHLRPVRPQQPLVSTAFVHDALWFVAGACFIGVAMPGVWGLLRYGYDHALWFLRIESVDRWPVALQIAFVILLTDLVRWFHHWVRHRVTLFWHFHAVHHSQRELNAFTDLRVHPVERIIEVAVSALPFFALKPSVALPAVAAWGTFGIWYARFYHANIRTNLGPLRYVLVTPQSHRIHHSPWPEHQDTNFGAILSIWDQMFGTQYRGWDEYPETGIADSGFPHERARGLRATTAAFLRQVVYPFRLAATPPRRCRSGACSFD